MEEYPVFSEDSQLTRGLKYIASPPPTDEMIRDLNRTLDKFQVSIPHTLTSLRLMIRQLEVNLSVADEVHQILVNIEGENLQEFILEISNTIRDETGTQVYSHSETQCLPR